MIVTGVCAIGHLNFSTILMISALGRFLHSCKNHEDLGLQSLQ